MTATIFQILTLIAALIGAAAAWAAFVRAGRWRDSDDGKEVKQDIHSIKNDLTKINGRLDRAEQADAGLPLLAERITKVETTLEAVATSADFAALKAEVEGLERVTRNTHASVARIEQWLMEGKAS